MTTQVNMWNNIPKQTFLKENGQIGDCWRCCIAAIIGLPAEEVPHFVAEEKGNADVQSWLSEKGYVLISASNISVPRWFGDNIEYPVICCGPTVRSKKIGEHHAVIMMNNEVVYDPHPSESGLLATVNQYIIIPQYETNRLP